MSITVETCGKAYCEHYPEGLPVCAKCREESTLAHDRACALLAEARADAEHWKSECNALQRMAHEARAEVESKNRLIEQMRDALKAIDGIGREAGTARREDALRCFAIAASALAAEGGEMS